MFDPRNSAYAVNLTYETYRHIYIYHAKSRLNTPVWGSLRSPNEEFVVFVVVVFCIIIMWFNVLDKLASIRV